MSCKLLRAQGRGLRCSSTVVSFQKIVTMLIHIDNGYSQAFLALLAPSDNLLTPDCFYLVAAVKGRQHHDP